MNLSKPLRLFALRDATTKKLATDAKGNILYFPDKRAAKLQRNPDQCVTPGPDHRRWGQQH